MKQLAKLVRDLGIALGPHTETTTLGHRLLHNRIAGKWVPFVSHVPSVWTAGENLDPDPAPKHYAHIYLLIFAVLAVGAWSLGYL